MYYLPKIFRKIKKPAIKRCKRGKDTAIESGSLVINVSIGSHSYCGYNCKILNTTIGRFCSIGDNVSIGLSNHRMDLLSTSPCFSEKKDSVKFKTYKGKSISDITTTIGNDVWIGEKVLIKAGLSLGDGCIVGMGSVVTKDVPPYTIVAGNPAKIIKYRFEDSVVQKLLKYKWWNLPDDILQKNNGFNGEPSVFIKWYEDNMSII